MVDFDEYRKRWVYLCPVCGTKVTAFRDCGQAAQCKCGSLKSLVEIIEPKHIEYTGSNNINLQIFKPYFDVGLGREVTSKKEIDDYCKQNNLIYAGDKEITEQCKINKRDNEIKQKEAFRSGLEKELSKVL